MLKIWLWLISGLCLVGVSTTIGFSIGYSKVSSYNDKLQDLCVDRTIKLKQEQYQQQKTSLDTNQDTNQSSTCAGEPVYLIRSITQNNDGSIKAYVQTVKFTTENASATSDTITQIIPCYDSEKAVWNCSEPTHIVVLNSKGELAVKKSTQTPQSLQTLQNVQTLQSVQKKFTVFDHKLNRLSEEDPFSIFDQEDITYEIVDSWGIPNVTETGISIETPIEGPLVGVSISEPLNTSITGINVKSEITVTGQIPEHITDNNTVVELTSQIGGVKLSDVKVEIPETTQQIITENNISKVQSITQNDQKVSVAGSVLQNNSCPKCQTCPSCPVLSCPQTSKCQSVDAENDNVYIIKTYNKYTDTYFYKTFTFGIKNTSSPLDADNSQEQLIYSMVHKCNPTVDNCTVNHEIIVDSLGQLLIQDEGQMLQPDQREVSIDESLFLDVDNIQRSTSWAIPNVSFNSIWVGQEINGPINGIMLQQPLTAQMNGILSMGIIVDANGPTELLNRFEYLQDNYGMLYPILYTGITVFSDISININRPVYSDNAMIVGFQTMGSVKFNIDDFKYIDVNIITQSMGVFIQGGILGGFGNGLYISNIEYTYMGANIEYVQLAHELIQKWKQIEKEQYDKEGIEEDDRYYYSDMCGYLGIMMMEIEAHVQAVQVKTIKTNVVGVIVSDHVELNCDQNMANEMDVQCSMFLDITREQQFMKYNQIDFLNLKLIHYSSETNETTNYKHIGVMMEPIEEDRKIINGENYDFTEYIKIVKCEKTDEYCNNTIFDNLISIQPSGGIKYYFKNTTDYEIKQQHEIGINHEIYPWVKHYENKFIEFEYEEDSGDINIYSAIDFGNNNKIHFKYNPDDWMSSTNFGNVSGHIKITPTDNTLLEIITINQHKNHTNYTIRIGQSNDDGYEFCGHRDFDQFYNLWNVSIEINAVLQNSQIDIVGLKNSTLNIGHEKLEDENWGNSCYEGTTIYNSTINIPTSVQNTWNFKNMTQWCMRIPENRIDYNTQYCENPYTQTVYQYTQKDIINVNNQTVYPPSS